MAKNRTMLDTVKFKVNELNKYLHTIDQRIELEYHDEVYEAYWCLKWFRPIDKHTEAEEHIFSGDELDIFSTLTGIEYGIRMKSYVYRF